MDELFQSKSNFARWLPVFLWALVIFVLSSIETVVVSQFFIWDFIAKKTVHVAEFAILFSLIFRATNGKWALTFVLTLSYAISDEYHQSFVPGRTAAVYDLGFDTTGSNIAAYLIWKLKLYRHNKPKKSPKT